LMKMIDKTNSVTYLELVPQSISSSSIYCDWDIVKCPVIVNEKPPPSHSMSNTTSFLSRSGMPKSLSGKGI
jgi:hypothetical protein